VVELKNHQISKGTRTKMYPGQADSSVKLEVANEAIDKLITEGGEGFYNYVDSLGLSLDPNLIVLSSTHHYYYDAEEISRAKTIVNLKELNRIKEISGLLHSHLPFLPSHCNFVGCFVNNNKVERFALRKSLTPLEKINNSDNQELGIVSRFPFMNMLYSFMDSRTDTYMSEHSVTIMLGNYGFKVLNMTDVNGLTFFHSQKVSELYN